MKSNDRNDDHSAILIKAFRRLDPNNEFVPGTSAYKDAEAMILKWIRIHGPDRTLQMVERCVKLMEDVARPQEGFSSNHSSRQP